MKLLVRFPHDSQIYVLKDGNTHTVTFHPFSSGHKITFSGSLETISEKEIQGANILQSKLELEDFQGQNQSKDDYISKLEEVINFVRAQIIPKLVISRTKFQKTKDLNIGQTFLNLCNKYPNAFCWWFGHKGESWLGATPEVLGKFSKKEKLFETMSLAGTLPVEEEWTDKEIEEQKPVTDYISKTLSKYSDKVEISPVHDHISGHIKHLRTDFTAQLPENQLVYLIKNLHPTPAICGVPKALCKKAIENFENHERELYAGYITIEDAEKSQSFVNLRCAKLYNNGILLYAGGGVTAKSNPEKEWRETELKMQAVGANLA